MRSCLNRLSRCLFGIGSAQVRSLRLLDENLSDSQRRQVAQHRYFDVVGGQSGRRYRIHNRSTLNVEELDDKGNPAIGVCFSPDGYLPTADVMLAQKLALELFELDALAVANRYRLAATPLSRR
jgi:hypothetical protein